MAHALVVEAIMWAEEDTREKVLGVLRWPEDTEAVRAHEQDTVGRKAARAVGRDADAMVAAAWAERQRLMGGGE